MMWAYLFWTMAFVASTLAYTTWGALRYGLKLEAELAELRKASLSHERLVYRRDEREAEWNELHTWPKNWSV